MKKSLWVASFFINKGVMRIPWFEGYFQEIEGERSHLVMPLLRMAFSSPAGLGLGDSMAWSQGDTSVQALHRVDSLRPHGLQHSGPPVHRWLPEFTQTHVH